MGYKGKSLTAKLNNLRIFQAFPSDLKELDQAYARIRPSDPDRDLYKIIDKYHSGKVFLLRKGKNIVSAAYCAGFPTGSCCLGGIFLDKKNGDAKSVLAVVRRCLQHLRAKGFSYVFSSVRQRSIDCYETLKAAGFIELYQRRLGVMRKIGYHPSSNSQKIQLLNKSDTKAVLERFSKSKKCSEKGTFSFCFWPHSLSCKSIEYLLNSNIMVLSDKENTNIVISHTAFAESAGKRWVILPPDDGTRHSGFLKTIGEVILTIGDDVLAPLSASIQKLELKGAEQIYAYDYGSADKLALYSHVGFSFEQPQIILVRKVSAKWPVIRLAKNQDTHTLDQFCTDKLT